VDEKKKWTRERRGEKGWRGGEGRGGEGRGVRSAEFRQGVYTDKRVDVTRQRARTHADLVHKRARVCTHTFTCKQRARTSARRKEVDERGRERARGRGEGGEAGGREGKSERVKK